MKYLQRIFSILLIAGMMLGWTASSPSLANSAKVPQLQEKAIDKFEPQLLEALQSGNSDFFVRMTEKADLGYADQLQTKAEKGRYVFETLVATADRTQADLRAYLDGQGVEYQSFYISNKLLVKSGSLALAMEIAGRKDVSEITANHKFQLEQPMIDPQAENNPTGIETNIAFVNAPEVWAMGYTGQGTVIAGNDTGLYYQHPALIRQYRGCIDPPACTTINHNFNWWDATGTYPNVPNDGHGHGTHTSGTMVGDDGGANQIGMAPGARMVHCKNMTDGGSGDDGTFTECFQWDLAPWDLSGGNANPDLAPDAINNSWGYWGGNQPQFRDEIDALLAAGIVVEVSAGNEGDGCTTLRSPGDYAEVFTTGSVNHAGGTLPGSLTGFSSRGPSLLDGNYFPDFMAPGENIRSSVPGGGYEGGWSGTSMSGPHLTALIGLIWSANPALIGQIDTTYSIIQQTIHPLTGQTGSNCGGDYTTGPNNDWGWGTIDAEAAVLLAVSFGGSGVLQGTVTDQNTSLPVAGATVSAVRQEGGTWTDTTDASGFYQMTVAAGTFDVTASRVFYNPETVNDLVVAEDGTTVQNIILVPLPIYTISGYVRETGTNNPLPGAKVEFTDAPVAPVFADDTGFYTIDIAEGTWTMKASAEQHADQTVTVEVTGDVLEDFSLSPFCDVLADNVEDGNIGWTAQSPWAITSESSHSPTHSWTDSPGGVYQNYVNTSLTSPLLDLSDFVDMKLSYWQTYATETGYDYAYVEYSTNGGSTWTSVATYQGTNTTWTQQEILLPELDDQANAKIRFRFTSDVSITYDGWHIDDIALSGGGPACVPDEPITGLAVISTSPDQLGETTTLTATVTGGSNVVYTWDFGDGTTGSNAEADHTYAAVGAYEATVTATNGSNSATATTTVNITDVPVAGLTATNSSPNLLGDTTTFTATVTGGTNVVFTWDFGDGSSATGDVVTHVYASAGMYVAVATGTNSVGSMEVESTVVINPLTTNFFLPFVVK